MKYSWLVRKTSCNTSNVTSVQNNFKRTKQFLDNLICLVTLTSQGYTIYITIKMFWNWFLSAKRLDILHKKPNNYQYLTVLNYWIIKLLRVLRYHKRIFTLMSTTWTLCLTNSCSEIIFSPVTNEYFTKQKNHQYLTMLNYWIMNLFTCLDTTVEPVR